MKMNNENKIPVTLRITVSLEAALEHASESFRVAQKALGEILAGGEVGQGRDQGDP